MTIIKAPHIPHALIVELAERCGFRIEIDGNDYTLSSKVKPAAKRPTFDEQFNSVFNGTPRVIHRDVTTIAAVDSAKGDS